MKDFKIFIVVVIFCILSCASPFNQRENDQYLIINKVIDRGLKDQDSLFIAMPYSIEEFKKKQKENELHNIFKLLDFTSPDDDNLMNFLKDQGVFVKNEIDYFKKQVANYNALDTSKFKAKKIRFLPRPKTLRDSMKYLSGNYSKYGFGFSRPVFTKNGNYGLIDYHSKHGGVYILVYEKQNKIWQEKASYLYRRH